MMVVDTAQITNRELTQLYNLRASAYLNMLYHGHRATTWSKWNLRLQLIAAIGSVSAVTALMSLATTQGLRWVAAILGAISGTCAIIPAIMGHSERINKFEKLHFAYCELFELTKRMISEVMRERTITAEQIGSVKMLEDLYSRLGNLEDPDHKDKLRNRCEAVVRDRFPQEDLWYATEDGEAAST